MNTKDAAKIQSLLQSGMNCGVYKEFLVFKDQENYLIYDKKFIILSPRQIKKVEFWRD